MTRTPKITYANVAATLALVMSLTGVGIAAVRLAEDQVTTRELAPNAVKNENIATGAVSVRNIAPKLRESLISIISAQSDAPSQIAPGDFQDFLTRDVSSAGDSGQRIVEGNLELTNPSTTTTIFVGARLIDVSSNEVIVARRASLAPGQTLVIPLFGSFENVGAADIRLQIRAEQGPVTAEQASMTVTTAARRSF